jgi:hypothetical protein
VPHEDAVHKCFARPLTAHYDTKTDLLDHVQRAPIDFLAAPMLLLMLLGALDASLAYLLDVVRRADARGL